VQNGGRPRSPSSWSELLWLFHCFSVRLLRCDPLGRSE
jgi:hypothetical protein